LFKFKQNENKALDLILGFSSRGKKKIHKALIHKSYNKTENNERLEFLGDTILGSVVSEHFYFANINSNEGELSKKRDAVISRKNLNQIAKEIFIDTGLKHKVKTISDNMYGDFLEALIGAIFLEAGYEEAKRFIKKRIINQYSCDQKQLQDFKGMLILETNSVNKKIKFVKLDHEGPDHEKRHKVGLLIDGEKIMTCWSKTIKEGERILSKRAYKKLYENNSYA
tara:strand:+ start:631 stop:1305 length:675 start_codon:yes stop_codon:yes gene_type:complete